jgi:hypothetical protein
MKLPKPALASGLASAGLVVRPIQRPLVRGVGHPSLPAPNAAAALAAPFGLPAEQLRLAILPLVAEIDPLGTRRDGLDAFLDQKVEEGYVIETRSDTHAIIFRRPKGLKRFTSGPDPGRYVVQVDEDGIATMRPAEPRRT